MVTLTLNERARSARSSAIRDLLDQARTPGMISFAGGIPDPELFPITELADLAAGIIRSDGPSALQYGTTVGEPETRAALAALFTDTAAAPGADGATTDVDPDVLVVTSGAQQALDLVARVLLEQGDPVVCGDPDYLGFLGVAAAHGAALHPVPYDSDGLDTDVLADALRHGLRPRACYVVPHFHNPTGVSLHPERRSRLAELSSHYGFVVIEDDPYLALAYDDEPGRPGPAATSSPWDPALTVQVRSTSKILAPGLRLGALRGPRELTAAVVIQKQAADLHTSTLNQALVTAALTSASLPAHLAELRTVYRDKRDVLLAALAEAFEDRVEVRRPGGGMFVWLTLTDGRDTTAWLTRALEHGACFVPGAAFAVEADLSAAARLCFVTATPSDLVDGVARLAAAL